MLHMLVFTMTSYKNIKTFSLILIPVTMAESQEDQMQSVVTCDICEDTAEHFCKTCQDRLCLKCRIIHNENKTLSDH